MRIRLAKFGWSRKASLHQPTATATNDDPITFIPLPILPFQQVWRSNHLLMQLGRGEIELVARFGQDIALDRAWIEPATIEEALMLLDGQPPSDPEAWWHPEVPADGLAPSLSREYLVDYVGYEPPTIMLCNGSDHSTERTIAFLVGRYLIIYCELENADTVARIRCYATPDEAQERFLLLQEARTIIWGRASEDPRSVVL